MLLVGDLRRCGFVGGSMFLQGVGFPLQFSPSALCLLLEDLSFQLPFLDIMPTMCCQASLPKWTQPTGIMAQVNSSVTCLVHGVISQ